MKGGSGKTRAVAFGLSAALFVAPFAVSSCTGDDPNSTDGSGGAGQPCFANQTCNPGLTCVSGACVDLPDASSGSSGDGATPAVEASTDGPPVDCGPTDPTTLIVDGVAGKDTNPGTAKCPLKTVTAALQLVNPVSKVTTVQVNGVATGRLVYQQETFPLSPQKSLTLKGQDGKDVVLHGSAPCGAAPCTVQVEVPDVTLANLTIEDPAANGDGVDATDVAKNLKLQKVTATNCGGAGVRAAGATGLTLDTATLTNNGQGLVLLGGATATATTTTVSHNTNEGALVSEGVLHSTSCTIAQNHVGVSIGVNSEWGTTKDIVASNVSHGAVSVACHINGDNSVISDSSTFSHNGGDGLQIGGCDQLFATKSTFAGNGGSGINLLVDAHGQLGDSQSGAGPNTFQPFDDPNGAAGLCNGTKPPFMIYACMGTWSHPTPTTSTSCSGKVDIANTDGNTVVFGGPGCN